MKQETPNTTGGSPVRERILLAARDLLAQGGVDALTNRAIAAAAGTQPPVIYRVFGDKQGLLDALAERTFELHLADKASLETSEDPVADLRAGWDQHVAFGLAEPEVYVMVYGAVVEGQPQPAALEAERMLAGYIHRVALAGRLRVPEALATQVMHAAGRGVTLTLLGMPTEQRDPTLSVTTREAAIAAITTDAPAAPGVGGVSAALALRAEVDERTPLSAAERALLMEWLDRIASTRTP